MTDNEPVHFSSVRINGYRGRYFDLKMKPKGKHSVFIMDGNTGKTTTIELLRWCFLWPESQAAGKFRHMWTVPAHVLDHKKQGRQECSISIGFTANGHNYLFERRTVGTYSIEKDPRGVILGDRIESISDSIDIDRGKDVVRGDRANEFLSRTFRFDQCAEYFCFDGEKAREVMTSAADQERIKNLVDIVNKRVTHPLLDKYRQDLDDLRRRIYSEAKTRTAGTRLTKKAIDESLSDLLAEQDKSKKMDLMSQRLADRIRIGERAKNTLKDQIKTIDQEIDQAQSDSLIKKTRIEASINAVAQDIEDSRKRVYGKCLDWVSCDVADSINGIKDIVREKGNLPEPYRDDLISACLRVKPPTCQICGRELDEEAKKRVKELGSLIAPHNVHVFLSKEFSLEQRGLDLFEENRVIKGKLGEYQGMMSSFNSIVLTPAETQRLQEKDGLVNSLNLLSDSVSKIEAEREVLVEAFKLQKDKVKDLQTKNEALKEYKGILDRIEETEDAIETAQQTMNEKAIKIVSEVISRSVSSILGLKFTASLTRESGLMLCEDDICSPEIGGMSGRLILSYCFAESITLVDPIIVDTPSGNIGSHRLELARHLAANHNQVILLCLPTEVSDFATVIADKDDMETVVNRNG